MIVPVTATELATWAVSAHDAEPTTTTDARPNTEVAVKRKNVRLLLLKLSHPQEFQVYTLMRGVKALLKLCLVSTWCLEI